MNRVQLPIKPITGNSIVECIQETIEVHGYPFYFNYDHGLSLMVPTDDFNVSKDGKLDFYYRVSIPVSLSPGYISLEPVYNPDALPKDFKICFLIRQKQTKKILGWLCWE
ncbi:hypothetical protein [Desulfitobacterium hafniense]|uniref:hypothetical protein n=1 Tax=Desulfitobacterium hafniense TaxID=49338 RepID=UPI000379041A|nr:hypothetical protein [Desulfitobacterium hafniense]